MKYNIEEKKQNSKIAFITDEFLVVGIDVGSELHYARAFDNRGFEYSRKPFSFANSKNGFDAFKGWVAGFLKQYHKKFVIVGMEPTGHYWFNLGTYINDNGMVLVHVNPAAVKKSKELDDNNPDKNDRKDPKVIAGLVKDGRYSSPYMPEGIYAEIRELSNQRLRNNEELIRAKNRLARWFAIYFPEFQDVYRDVDSKSGMAVLRVYQLPADIVKAGADKINQIWRDLKIRGVGLKRARELVSAAEKSIGRTTSPETARMELENLLEDLEKYQEREKKLMEMICEKLPQIKHVEKLLEIKGVGINTVVTFIAEVGDISRFRNPKEIQKLAGLSIVENSSGKHKGESSISYRGRKRLRHALYEVAVSLIGYNEEFAEIHHYYTTREHNPLKKIQSVVAVACKVIRVFYAILSKGTEYDGSKMIADIVRPQAA